MPGVRCNEHVLHPISTGFGYDIDLSLTFFPHTARTTGRGEIFVPLKRANGDPQFEMLDLVVSHTASTEQATAGLGSIVHDRQTICKDLVTGVKDTLGEGGVTYLTVEGHSSRLTASNNQHLGLPLHPESISQLFERQLARVGVPRIRFHDLRHTNATLGLAAGVPTKIMSARLGHATTAFTQDVYMKSTDPLERDAATRIAGGYEHMLAKHLGLGITDELRLRFVTLLSRAADGAGLPNDPEFRAAIMGYAEWGSRLALHNSQSDADVVAQAPVPRWGWGVAPPYRP